MSTGTIQLHRLNLSSTKLAALPIFERYVFALTGHIFNELMIVQKMLLASKPKTQLSPFEQDAAVGTALFVLKLLGAKAHEAMSNLCKATVQAHLRRAYFDAVPGLSAQWERTVAQYEALEWLVRLRNQGAFHYMSQGQWADDLEPEDCEGAYVVIGKTYGDTLFWWNEIRASVRALRLADADDPITGLTMMLDVLGGLLGDITDCLAQGMQNYIAENLTEDGFLEEAVGIEVPYLDDIFLSYFACQRHAD